jgi:hypothetical protein
MLISCKKTGDKKGTKLEQKEKAPSTLASISEEFDKIFSSIKEIKEIENLSPQEFEILKTKTKDTKDKSNEKPKESEKEKTEGKIEDKDKELTKKWADIDKKIEKIHKSWNDYEIEAMKKSANPEKTKEFKNNLNLCTKAVEDRNIDDILDTGSKAVLSLSKFFDLYKDEIGGELLKIKYAIYQADLLGGTNIENAKNLLDSTGENITRLRQKLSKDKEKTKRLDKLDLAIGDMKQSLNEDNKKLLELKKDIIINNMIKASKAPMHIENLTPLYHFCLRYGIL